MKDEDIKKVNFGGGLNQYVYDGTSANLIMPATTRLQENITALNDFSTGLNVSMQSPFTKDYASTLEVQRGTLKLINDTGGLFDTASALGATASVSGAIADIGLTTIHAHRLYDSGVINENQLRISGDISDTLLGMVHGQQAVVQSGIIGLRTADSGIYTADRIPFITSTRLVSSGIDSMMRSLPTYPTEINFPSLSEVKITSQIKKKELSDHQEKLDSMLKKINPELVEYRRGAWETFDKKGKDYIGQSTSSMRRLVDTLLHTLAPDDEVKNTDFYKTDQGNKDGKPTRKARLRHIVKFEEKGQSHLERLVHGIDSFLKVYDNLPTWNHAPLKQEEFVYGGIRCN
ncbi:MAG: hypothetical protein UW07_C0047G0004 [Candidatus Nomurabacteria bacterium GW2011_GWF2_43_8]|uniref:Predicted pPIWI-associating nuclease domain-containing protein n=3 Tax=Candidatus Nomuraibacteriota TaxID=1752729 RepID=A0A0G1FI03_9BACT|nr:MAG: hypothetical protein UV76_C0021G0003 [Candidatus Nomurabacteria bacterium GW2011_GWA2_43_15]KKT18624.1 MAG: hypothetical protein UW02_C0026G0020 [Candidatus Nomurabacteria bacterium GW2011_GWB1_43_7]KKT22035.1 MAG: hypothetical protein UW07_C0047G0004 [Candidatus Nomurabacteria bacterium GW2011_GWF2_43_8]